VQPRAETGRRELEHLRRLALQEAAVALGGHRRVGRLDHVAQPHREFDERAHVRPALGLVGVEQRLGRGARAPRGELPPQVGRVADAGAQALAEERRRLVRGVAGEQQAAAAPAGGDHRVEGVDRAALEPRVGGRHPAREQRPDVLGPADGLGIVAGHQHDLPAAPAPVTQHM
jgi:hypothetical protein